MKLLALAALFAYAAHITHDPRAFLVAVVLVLPFAYRVGHKTAVRRNGASNDPRRVTPAAERAFLMTTLYVAGPLSLGGLLNPDAIRANLQVFHDAEIKLRDSGYNVLNPARHDYDPDKTWLDYMRLGLSDVIADDGVALLPLWEHSRGARIEVRLARDLGMRVMPAPRWSALAAVKL